MMSISSSCNRMLIWWLKESVYISVWCNCVKLLLVFTECQCGGAVLQEVTAVFFTALCFFFFFSKIWMWTSVEHMRGNWVLNPSPVSRSSASPRYCSCGLWLSAHHFRYLQLPHLQVSLIASVCAAFSSNSRNAGMIFSPRSSPMKKKRERHVWGRIYGPCCYRCQCGIYTIVATATAQQVTLKQQWSVLKLPSELIHRPQTAHISPHDH